MVQKLETREDIRKWLRVVLDQGLCTESQNEAWGLINSLVDIEHQVINAMCEACEEVRR